jgi:hypothetical protein
LGNIFHECFLLCGSLRFLSCPLPTRLALFIALPGWLCSLPYLSGPICCLLPAAICLADRVISESRKRIHRKTYASIVLLYTFKNKDNYKLSTLE